MTPMEEGTDIDQNLNMKHMTLLAGVLLFGSWAVTSRDVECALSMACLIGWVTGWLLLEKEATCPTTEK